jgi:hypothetical protein
VNLLGKERLGRVVSVKVTESGMSSSSCESVIKV